LLFTPDDPEIHLNSGLLALHGFADYERAERHLREAVRLRPVYRDALLQLAALLARQGRWADAEASWRDVLKVDPDNHQAREGLAAAQRAQAARR
jgi:Flp pilus assembly protein TadD